ncbi:MAG: hypothetical protein PHW66_07080 [Gallionella sp.]|jgi:hypothetical protein|nr:hypothetical protein [Gallionella sp.]
MRAVSLNCQSQTLKKQNPCRIPAGISATLPDQSDFFNSCKVIQTAKNIAKSAVPIEAISAMTAIIHAPFFN